MLERDQNFPEFEEILSEVDRIREISAAASELKAQGKAPKSASAIKQLERKQPTVSRKELAEVKHARVLSA
jgi:hypothetical protein